jgi:hypothetical protein
VVFKNNTNNIKKAITIGLDIAHCAVIIIIKLVIPVSKVTIQSMFLLSLLSSDLLKFIILSTNFNYDNFLPFKK